MGFFSRLRQKKPQVTTSAKENIPRDFDKELNISSNSKIDGIYLSERSKAAQSVSDLGNKSITLSDQYKAEKEEVKSNQLKLSPAAQDQWDESDDAKTAGGPSRSRMGRMFSRRRAQTAISPSIPKEHSLGQFKRSDVTSPSDSSTLVTDYSDATKSVLTSSSTEETMHRQLHKKTSLLHPAPQSGILEKVLAPADAASIPEVPLIVPSVSPSTEIKEMKIDAIVPTFNSSKMIRLTGQELRERLARSATLENKSIMSPLIPVKSPVRRGNSVKATKRPATAASAIPTHILIYITQLSPPPQGLPIEQFEARKNAVTSYVRRRTLEEMNPRDVNHRPSTSASPSISGLALNKFEEAIVKLEEDLHNHMQQDFYRGVAVSKYKELHLADVFIEARRELGLQSNNKHLHDLYDLLGLRSTSQSRESNEVPIISSVAPIWTGKAPPALSPAPRKRRPRTSPVGHANQAGIFIRREPSARSDQPATPDLSLSSSKSASLDDNSTSSFDKSNTIHENRHSQSDRDNQANMTAKIQLLKSVSYNIMPSSLPPSPPRSIESHLSSSTAVTDNYAPSKQFSKLRKQSSKVTMFTSQDVDFEIMPRSQFYSGHYPM